MRDWIAGVVTVLGTLLILGGGGTTLLRIWWRPGTAETGPTPAQQTASELFGPSPVPPIPAAATERADAAIASVMLAVVLTLTTRIFTNRSPQDHWPAQIFRITDYYFRFTIVWLPSHQLSRTWTEKNGRRGPKTAPAG